MSPLEEIADNWHREAKREDSERYFYFINEIKQISSGKKSFVIGRKGSGKTAINEYLFNTQNTKDIFAKTLSFTDFPYNQLYELKDMRYSQKSEYISIWKYIIYSSICEMMLKNSKINEDARTELSSPYEKDLLTELPRKLEKWTGSSFNIPNITNSDIKSLDWTQKIYLQEDIVKIPPAKPEACKCEPLKAG
ncbi:MAG: P-loop ATPase, Sll1717 family [Methylobacter sp.]